MKLRKTLISLGISAATATGLSLLKVNKDLVVGSTAVVVGAGLMIALKDKIELNKKARDYEYFFNRAQDKFELADYEEAILDYNKALELSPTEICLVYSMRGNAKRNSGDFEGAISDQNKALDFDPLYADGYFNRGIAKFKKGDFDDAIEDYSQVIKINPKDSDAFFNRGHVKKEMGEMKGACEDWRKAAELGDDDAAKFFRENCE
ncbi:tetratricopeptide repeat protein [Prochlorococcus sp. MIT 0801]|uniref:tetratricopeptide repeat protein n=1 Tax=Prochlorococcus sp. MIT 0801 TaxID=1501269 RepID=UPI0004F8793A|nr:tetratricopeptide repeat protein [Prochlorococcus sp. MIT 0801]AIQ96580.1 TPR repeat [Prochlorococcus sp. MIT 0801]